MRLYLDEDMASPVLARTLQRAGHDVQVPSDVGMRGASDASQLAHATREDRVILSRNYGDYEDLHDLVQVVGGRHAGIFIVREERDRRRNMKSADIVRAIANVIAAGIPIRNEYIILNAWR
jgi:predicted nuclease of predicted toxin-antitoxin system